MTSRYHSSYLTAGCWSPSRPGVFFVARSDGVVDVWDYYHRQNEVALSHKVGDAPLSCIALSGESTSTDRGATGPSAGKLMAVGDAEGTVSLVQLSDSLALPQANERAAIVGMFERETKREKNLNANQREIEARRVRHARDARLRAEQAEKVAQSTTDKTLEGVDAAFLRMMRES